MIVSGYLLDAPVCFALLQQILAGSRDAALADDPDLDYDDAVEVRLLIEQPDTLVLGLILRIVILVAAIFGLAGLFTVQPNQGVVLQLFGRYIGTVKAPGLKWANPFYSKKAISLRVRNFETSKMKVNDHDGNPIEIAAVVVWKVVNTAEALFEVDDYEDFVAVQSEAALRNMASRHPYDSEDHEISLRGSTAEICQQLEKDIQERLDKAGVDVIESRISHLAYAPEIAAAMLQRQQAGAVVAARTKIVEGAVGMVEDALDHLSEKRIVQLDEERQRSGQLRWLVSALAVMVVASLAAVGLFAVG